MNAIWIILIITSFIYGLINNRIPEMVTTMYEVLNDSTRVIFKIASGLIVWNSLFSILNKCNVVSYIAKPFKMFIKPLKLNENNEVEDNLSVALVINALGLGLASVPYMVNALKKCRKENVKKILLFNLCPITLFPSTILALRNDNNIVMWILIISLTVILYLISIIYIRFGHLNE